MKGKMTVIDVIGALQDNFGPEDEVEFEVDTTEDIENRKILDAVNVLVEHKVIALRITETDGVIHFEPEEFKQRKITFQFDDNGVYVTGDSVEDHFSLLEKPDTTPF